MFEQDREQMNRHELRQQHFEKQQQKKTTTQKQQQRQQQKQDSYWWAKLARLYSDLIQAQKIKSSTSLDSQQWGP